MPRAESSFVFYGIFVKTIDLLIACDAHSKIKGALFALDLIMLRRDQEAVRVDGTESMTAITRVSSDIWILVRKELLKGQDQAREEAGSKLGYSVVCRRIDQPKGCPDCNRRKTPPAFDFKRIYTWSELVKNKLICPSTLDEKGLLSYPFRGISGIDVRQSRQYSSSLAGQQ